jgi:hypothetical protein
MTKYQKIFQEMSNENQDLFTKFKDLHDKYAANPKVYQKLFNQQGAIIVDVIRQYERKLCGHSERGQYGKFSGNLSDKFWSVIRVIFPKIDFVGVE